MRNRLKQYLRAEWGLALLLSGLGSLSALLAGSLFFFHAAGLYLGLAWPCLLLGSLACYLGLSGLYRVRQLGRRLLPLLNRDPQRFLTLETNRLRLAEPDHRRRQLAEQLLLSLGILLLLLGGFRLLNDFGLGIAVGLSSLAALLLIVNILQQWSRGLYRHELEMFRRDGEK